VDIEGSYLNFDPSTGELKLIRGAKMAGALRAMQIRILRYVKLNPGATASSIDSYVSGSTTLKAKARPNDHP